MANSGDQSVSPLAMQSIWPRSSKSSGPGWVPPKKGLFSRRSSQLLISFRIHSPSPTTGILKFESRCLKYSFLLKAAPYKIDCLWLLPVFNPLLRTVRRAIASKRTKYKVNKARMAMEVGVWGASRILAQPCTKGSQRPGPTRSET